MAQPRSARGVPVGQTVAHFRVVGTVGEGGMGIVYEAHDEQLHRKVALKVLHPEVAGNRDRRKRFLREARVAGSVTHPSIATVYEVGEDDGRIYIAMELVTGTSLKKLLEKGALSPTEALRIARVVARGLVKAHEEGIIHRDLKPDNVMVGEDEIVKILDFGLAKPREKEGANPEIWTGKGIQPSLDDTSSDIMTARWALVGTPAYMSPEQAKGRDVDERSDLFSLGVILFEMLTGARPFKGETWQEVIISINRDVVPPVSTLKPELPPLLDALVAKCLDKDPDKRFQNCRTLVAAIDEALGKGRESQIFESGTRKVDTALQSALDSSPGSHAVPPSTSSPDRVGPASLPSSPSTMIAATSAPALPALPVKAPSNTRNIVLGVAGGVLVGAALLAIGARTGGARGAATAQPVVSVASSASSAPKRLVAITDFPAPPAANPEAAKAYASALQNLRDGSIAVAGQELRRANDLDPTHAAAALRHVAYDAIGGSKDERRRYYQIANQARSTLSERDQTILKSLEPLVLPDAPDREAHVKRVREIVAARSEDAELQLLLAQAELGADHHAQAEQAVERAIALDPKFALAAWMQAMIAEAEGDAAGQLRASARCLEIAPSAGSCLRMRAHVNALSGDCPAVEADARRMVAVEPQSNRAYLQLARALASRGASQDAIWEVLQNQSKMLAERLRPEVEHEGRASLSALFGDFATAETELAAEEAALVSTSTESGHASMAMRVAVAREAGDFARAAKLAKELLDKKAGWIADDASFEGLMIANAVRGDALPRAQAELLRQHAIADLRKQLPPGVANAAWTWIYAWPAETPEEAREALGALPSFSPLPSGLAVEDLPLADGLIGKVYQLAGKTDEALPLLQRGAKSCNALSMPIEHTQLSFYLGQALETKGDTAGACAAYKTVLDRWSGAKPRSITLEKSRSRYMSLVCDKK